MELKADKYTVEYIRKRELSLLKGYCVCKVRKSTEKSQIY